MRVRLSSLSIILLVLMPAISHTMVLGIEDCAPRDPWGNVTDSLGDIPKGCQGFDWSNERPGCSGTVSPRWASHEGSIMPGVGGHTYVHTPALSMADSTRTFDIARLSVGSYFYSGQDVYAQAWENGSLKYPSIMTIDTVFRAAPFTLDYIDIDRFALWAGDGGTLVGPALADHELCIDDISCNPHDTSSPIPEPSTLLIVSAGLFGLARMCRRYSDLSTNH